MTNFIISRVIFICTFLFASLFFGQKKQDKKIVFGETYTLNELKSMNGIIRCASTSYEKYLQDTDPNRMSDAEFEAWIQPLIENAKNNKSTANGIVTIPVVVHVIHNGQALGTAPNITDAQVQSQITVLNNDFRRAAGTPGFNTSPLGADVMVQFALAKVDPNGNPTNGINRVNLCKGSYTTAEVNSLVKPQTIWDPTQYMNMWSVQFGGSSSNILGYAQFPTGSGLPGLPATGAATTDGVVANFSMFGSSDYNDGTFLLSAPYDKGRTMTHEVGHFLGLRHIWGDATCGTDYCADTPTANAANYTCTKNKPSCDLGLFEMVENYMDYTNDTCMNIFTINQKDRITAVMNNSPRRTELKTSTKDQPIALFANDAEIKFERVCGTAACGITSSYFRIQLYNRGTSPLTSATISYTIGGGAAQTYTWTGNLSTDKYAIVTIPVSTTIAAGALTANITAVNGTADQRATNNSFAATYTPQAPQTVAPGTYVFTLQNDPYGSEVAWTLKNSAGNIVYQSAPYVDGNPNLPPVITQNWTLSPDCYTFTITDTYGDGIYSYGGYYNLKTQAGTTVFEGEPYTTSQTRSLATAVLATGETVMNQGFAVYPNPVSDILNVTKVSNKAKYKIHNAVGQLVKAGEINNNQIQVSELVKGTYIITVDDKEVSQSVKFIKK